MPQTAPNGTEVCSLSPVLTRPAARIMGAGAMMRQAEEAEAGAHKDWLPHYQQWEPEAMGGAYERWKNGRPEEVGRAAWFDLFNEYTVIAVGGHFVTLDMEEFNRLSRYGPSRNPNAAPTRLPFVMMALLGDGDPKHKADVVFDMYAAPSGTVGPAELRPLMATLITALHVLGLTRKPAAAAAVGAELASTPSSPRLDVDDIVKGCFDKESTPLDREGFWLCWRNKRAVVVHAIEDFGKDEDGDPKKRKSQRKERSTLPRKKRSEKRLNPARSQARQDRAGRRYSVAAAQSARSKEHARDMEHRKRLTGSYEMTDEERKRDFTNYMSRVNKVASQKILQELMDATGMDYSDLSMLRQEFAFALSNKVMPDKMDAHGKWQHSEMSHTMSLGRLKSVRVARVSLFARGAKPFFRRCCSRGSPLSRTAAS